MNALIDADSELSGLARVRSDIAAACAEAKRDPASVTLIAVSKTFGTEAIEPVIAAGQRVFGENRVQEAKAKWPALRAAHPDIALHLIGPLQSNKAKDAVALFDAIHSVDRPSIAEALAKEIAKQGRHPLLFVEVNTGEEPQKAGVLPQDADAFIKACGESHGLTIAGLMCIPPLDEAPGAAFRARRQDRGAQRTETAFDGDERGFCRRDRVRRDPCAGRTAIFGGRQKKSPDAGLGG
jgi:pyridoxal phosphate enzyme (YggS family)